MANDINLTIQDDQEISLTIQGNSTAFSELTDTPTTYSGQSGKTLQVKSSEDGLEFVPSAGSDEKIKISANDTTPSFLDTKLTAGTNVTLTVLNDGANESLQIDVSGVVAPVDSVNGLTGVVVLDTDDITEGTNKYISTQQASDITDNNLKVSYTDSVAVGLNTAKNSYPSADQTKVNHISVTQAVNLDTIESDTATNNAKVTYPSIDSTKVGFITITQSVNLDTIETDVNINNAKVTFPEAPIDGSVYGRQNGNYVVIVGGGDEKIKISANDTTAGYLNGKLVAGTNITLTENNDGANETLTISTTTVDITALENQVNYNSSTGLLSGGAISINGGDNTTFDISLGNGIKVDNTTDPMAPVKTEVSWTAFSGVTVTNIGTQLVTYVSINSSGAIVQESSIPNATQRRINIFLGVVIHSNNVIVNAINNLPSVSLDDNAQLQDLMNALGFFSVSGNLISDNGANLEIKKTAGFGFKAGGNFQNDNTNPHKFSMALLEAPTFRYRDQNSTEGSDTILIDPTQYDNAGTLTTVSNNNNATIQRVFIFPSNIIRVQWGQEVFSNFSAAIDQVGSEGFVVENNIAENGLFLGSLVVRKNATDLSDTTEAKFIPSAFIGGSGGSSTTLQGSYDISSNPEIITDSTRGAVTFQRGSALDTDAVIEVKDGAGTTNFSVDGNGDLTANTYTGDGSSLTNVDSDSVNGNNSTLLLGRANHTGTQLSNTISDIQNTITNNTQVLANTSKVGVTTEISSLSEDTTPQLTGDLDGGDNNITGLKQVSFNNWFVNTFNATQNIDFSNGKFQELTLTGNNTITFSNGLVGVNVLKIIQDGTGSMAITFSNIQNATAPEIIETANGETYLIIIKDSSGNYSAFSNGVD